MQAKEKFAESLYSVLPIMLIVLALHWTIVPIGETLWQFLTGGALLVIGLSIFLLGTEIGMVPIGQKAGAALTSRKNFPLMLGAGFVIGFLVTVAEPDVQVLATQVASVDASISPTALVFMIAAGVGLFVAVAMGRIILQVPLKLVLALFYALVFVCAFFTSPSFLGIAFDAGGATTGPMTVPFIMALGVGVAAVRSGRSAGRKASALSALPLWDRSWRCSCWGCCFRAARERNCPMLSKRPCACRSICTSSSLCRKWRKKWCTPWLRWLCCLRCFNSPC